MSQYANEKIKCSFCEKFFIPLYNKNSTRYLERKHNKFLNYLNNIEKEE